MTEICLASIVEGHGEVDAVPTILRRICTAIDSTRVVAVLRPIRVRRGQIIKPGEVERYVELAARRLGGRPGGVLVLLDADDDCAAEMGNALHRRASDQRSDTEFAVVLPVREFESWFLAAAASLAGHRGLRGDLQPPQRPDGVRDAKGWLQRNRIDGRAYSPTVDQPALAARFDLEQARSGAPSFDKLWRDVERLMSSGAVDA